ncbi:putative transmembrane ascorbate ferrireductase 2-like isoform X1, partial [Leptotrombidium deliense]
MLFTIAELLLIGTVAIFVYFVLMHDKGFAWTNNRQAQWNLHGVLMLVGFIFMNGQALLMYKLLICIPKIYVKIIHTLIFLCSISAIAIGMISGIQAQASVPRSSVPKHFYSIHSWAGLVTCGLFALQFFVGFVSFLVLLCCDKATSGFRKKLLPTHVTFGLIIFSLGALSCITGIFQTARFRL